MVKFLIMFSLIVFFFSCSKEEEVDFQPIRPVRTAVVKEYSTSLNMIFPAEIKSAQETNLSFRVGGIIDEINFKIGENIKEGELIAVIDDADYKLKYNQVSAQLDSLKAGHQATASALQRVTRLYENNNISLQDFENVQAKYNAEKNQIQSVSNQLKLIKNQLNYTRLYAPYDGVISRKLKDEKESTNAYYPVFSYINPNLLEAVFFASDNVINKINIGDVVEINMLSIENVYLKGVVKQKHIEADRWTKTYQVTVEIVDPVQNLLPGMSCEVYYDIEVFDDEIYAGNIMLIPESSVFPSNDGEQTFVWLFCSETNTVAKQKVHILRIVSEGILISEGLKIGDVIVNAGVNYLSENQKVSLL